MTIRLGLWQSLVCGAGLVVLGVMAVLALAQHGGASSSVVGAPAAAVADGWHTSPVSVLGVPDVAAAPSAPVVPAVVPAVDTVAAVAPVEAGPLACWTEPKPASLGGPERVCGDVHLAPVTAVDFGPWPVATSTHPTTHAARVKAPRPLRLRPVRVQRVRVHTVKAPKPVKAPRAQRVKAQPVTVPVVLVSAAAVG